MRKEYMLITGLIGSHVANKLLPEFQYEIVAIVRRKTKYRDIDELKQKDVKIIKSDFFNIDPEIQVCHHHRSIFKDYVGLQNRISAVTSKVLKMIKMEGSYIANNPEIAILLFHVLSVVKFVRTIAICLRYQPDAILKRPLVVFLFIDGLISLNIGYVRGVFEKDNRKS